MVIGLFEKADEAAMCLTNLEEEDFSRRDISVVMRTKQDVESIADVEGPLNAITVDELTKQLIRRGLSPEAAAAYRDGILKGGVFIAVQAGDAEAAAKETLEDHNAKDVRVIKDA